MTPVGRAVIIFVKAGAAIITSGARATIITSAVSTAEGWPPVLSRHAGALIAAGTKAIGAAVAWPGIVVAGVSPTLSTRRAVVTKTRLTAAAALGVATGSPLVGTPALLRRAIGLEALGALLGRLAYASGLSCGARRRTGRLGHYISLLGRYIIGPGRVRRVNGPNLVREAAGDVPEARSYGWRLVALIALRNRDPHSTSARRVGRIHRLLW